MNDTSSLSPSGNKIQDKLYHIWENVPKIKYQYPEGNLDSIKNFIVFLGLNPSLRKGADDTRESYPIVTDNTKNDKDKFFGKFHTIGAEIFKEYEGNHWAVMDLLYIRETNQKCIEKMYRDPAGKEFITKQVNLTLDILQKINPKLVVVANKFAENLLLGYEGFKTPPGENHIFRYKGIPFVMKESKFMGNGRLWASKKEKSLALKKTMYAEIERVLSFVAK